MKKVTKIAGSVIALATAVAQIPGVSDAVKALVAAHPHSVLGALGLALIGALVHNPSKGN